MTRQSTLGALLRSQGVSRRAFLKFCTTTASGWPCRHP
jgi:hydrogenase small subunit